MSAGAPDPSAARKPRLIVVERAALPARAAGWLADAARRAVAARGACRLALSGGETPEPVYRALAAMPEGAVPWEATDIFFGDERAVPPDDPQSNFRMAREALLSRVAVAPARIHRVPAERGDLDVAAAEYARLLVPPLDILLLGIGGDGHTASLFPGSPLLGERRRLVAVVRDAPKPPPTRLTITPPVLAAARDVLVLASGPAKAAIVARAALGPADPQALPIQLALEGTWMLDTEAAADLRGGRFAA